MVRQATLRLRNYGLVGSLGCDFGGLQVLENGVVEVGLLAAFGLKKALVLDQLLHLHLFRARAAAPRH